METLTNPQETKTYDTLEDVKVDAEEISKQLQAVFDKASSVNTWGIFSLDPREEERNLVDKDGVIVHGISHGQTFYFFIADEKLGARTETILTALRDEAVYRKDNNLPPHNIQLNIVDTNKNVFIVKACSNKWGKGYKAFYSLANEMYEPKKPMDPNAYKAMIAQLKTSPRFTKLNAPAPNKVVAPAIAASVRKF